MKRSMIQNLGKFGNNTLYIKREDLLPYCFGGNKARKAVLFFEEIDRGGYDAVVTYGSSSSNHGRIISNMCAQRGLPCYIVTPQEIEYPTFNSYLMKELGAQFISVPVNRVQQAIESQLNTLRQAGKNPYFIEGGGHGNTGTRAYVQCYEEIKSYEAENGVYFDYIFFASGTGTTQAGLVCGQLLHQDRRHIIGISIARKNPYGRDVVLNSIRSYIQNKFAEEAVQSATHFVDQYTGKGYGGGTFD